VTGRRPAGDRGAVTTELVLITPLVLVLLHLLVFAGRYVDARSDVVSASRDAARAASIQRNAADAEAIARETVDAALDREGIRCAQPPGVAVSTSGPNGTGDFVSGNFVRVRVECEVRYADLAWLDIPGARSSAYTAVEIIDVYRGAG
jgi:TadE-like protein